MSLCNIVDLRGHRLGDARRSISAERSAADRAEISRHVPGACVPRRTWNATGREAGGRRKTCQDLFSQKTARSRRAGCGSQRARALDSFRNELSGDRSAVSGSWSTGSLEDRPCGEKVGVASAGAAIRAEAGQRYVTQFYLSVAVAVVVQAGAFYIGWRAHKARNRRPTG